MALQSVPDPSPPLDDVAIVGAGGAGLSLLLAIDAAVRAAGTEPPRITLVDPVHRAGADRTWCYWEDPAAPVGGPAVAALAHRRWPAVTLRTPQGLLRHLALDPWRYVMVRSADFYAAADLAAERLGVRRVTANAGDLTQTDSSASVATPQGPVSARWVFDSRPVPPLRPARTALLQHFRGWTVRFTGPVVDPVPTFMDFSTPQPARGVSFAYCLPLATDRALIEYTEFSPAVITSAEYDRALAEYLRERWGVGEGEYVVEAVEDGVIPMTDAVHPRREGRVLHLGTAGGATRPATGFTFAAMNRQAVAVASALVAGTDPVPPRPYPARHSWMDSVLLRALDRDLTSAPDLFLRLFARNPPARVLRFLDGATTPREELQIMASCPTLPMMRAAAGLRPRHRP